MDYSIFEKTKVLTYKRKNYEKRIIDLYCAFDIETSKIITGYDDSIKNSLPEPIYDSFMYIWQFQIDDYCTVIGRSWPEYIYFLGKISEHLPDGKLIIYVHNLSFEFQFLSGIYNFSDKEVFSPKRRKILKCDMMNKFEYRCSYYLTNMSLKKFTEKMKVKDMKLSGDDFDYSKIRYPWTQLSDEEIQYCVNDVKGLVQALKKNNEVNGDTLLTVPLTSTGYIRRDIKDALRGREVLLSLNPEEWVELREAFRGGDTHANRFYANKIIENVNSWDRSSSYPDVMVNCQFPMTDFEYMGEVDDKVFNHCISHFACLFRLTLDGNIRLKNRYNGMPYIAYDKSRHVQKPVLDNGRILSADYLEITVTDLDYKIIMKEYVADSIAVKDLRIAKYKKLPKPIIEKMCEYYKIKTELKGIKEKQFEYDKFKNRINSGYGMCAQNPVMPPLTYNGLDFQYDDKYQHLSEKTGIIQELLEKQEETRFINYVWGVWVTAWARYRLREAMWNIGLERVIYVDTDSVKYRGEANWGAYNKERIADSLKSGAYANDSIGITHYMGVMEEEKGYDRFITMGAKKYAYEQDGGLHITIAGVDKKKGAKELGKLENFKEGFTFIKAGGSRAVYHDIPTVQNIKVEGHLLPITKNVTILDTEYTLGITSDYAKILTTAKYILEDINFRY